MQAAGKIMEDKPVTLDDITKAVVPELRKGDARLAVLFGSYARGDADQFSDLDLIVVAETGRPFVERFKDFSGVWRVSPVKRIDMFVYTPEEFESMQRADNPFISRALEEGKIIFEARRERAGEPLVAPG